MRFLDKYYKPWSFKWVIQRFILVLKEGRLPQIRPSTLVTDYKLTRQVWKSLRDNYHTRRPPSFYNSNIESLLVGDMGPSMDQVITCKNIPEEQLSIINSYFDHIYVVNLERRQDRRLEMIQKLTRLNIRVEFFPAVDGYTPENTEEFKEYLESPIDPDRAHPLEIKLRRKVIYSAGAWGTLKTYHNLINDAKKRGFKRIFCLQDDAVFARDFEEKFRQAKELVPEEWKLLYLGASQHGWKEGTDLIRPETADEGHLSYYIPLNTDGAFAIGIDHKAYDFLLEEIEKMNCSFDAGPMREATKKFRNECYVIEPNIIIADVKESDIRVARRQDEFARTVKWDMKNYDFPFEQELVSVIMPAYNAEKTIERSIRSILDQTYKNLELIVVDDFSTDSTEEVVRKLAREDKRVKYIKQEKNMGCYPTRNAGIRASKGDIIAFQDADDLSFPERIETQIVPICLGKAQFTMSRIVRSTRGIEEFDMSDPGQYIGVIADDMNKAGGSNNDPLQLQKVGYITSVYTRNLFEELGLFWENRFGSDAEYVERVLFYKKGIELPKNVYAQIYLAQVAAIEGLFHRIDRILMISLLQGEQNLSQKHKQKERLEFQKLYRKRLVGQVNYDYPGF